MLIAKDTIFPVIPNVESITLGIALRVAIITILVDLTTPPPTVKHVVRPCNATGQ